ncbi:hypothetical protein BZA05DRAFT_447768 [Tricharina praecox]|uniref:uncharacterized protein n=1 Tax=Tricharina praecox TaxID=43433 RepID=UPI00221EBF19|nr:uncharacterized protein BZA05DRAFT_447768 [Tricharina praecox]KAI5845452.1 hypothetical protein BZA05DRAFT_447768 [Tricharina praecox]
MKPQQPAVPVPTEVTLMIIDALPGIHEYLDVRDTSWSNREICDMATMATLRRLLQMSTESFRSQPGEADLEPWLIKLRRRLEECKFPSGPAMQRAFFADVAMQGDRLWWRRMGVDR